MVSQGFFSGSADRKKRMAGSSDTKVALGGDNLGSMGGIGAVIGVGALGIKGIQSAVEGGKRLKENIQRRINPQEEDNKQSFFSPRLKKQKVALGESGFTYESDTSFLDKDPDFNEVKKTYQGVYETLPGRIKKDIKLDYLDRNPIKYKEFLNRAEKMKEDAKARQAAFKDTGVQTFGGKVQPQKSADVTYGTNMLSNPAFGFRSKMKPEDQKKYDKSARDATEMARPDPSLGNVLTSVGNIVKKALPNTPFTRQASLESIGERQLKLANKEVNRPTYQKEAFARNYLGISIGDIRARQRSIIEQNARARNEAFKAERAQKAIEKAAIRRGGNIGTGRDGSPGLGTSGQSMPSNPKGFSGYSRKSSPSSSSTSTSKSQGRGGRRGGSTGGSGSSSKGGTGSGGTKTSSSVKASKASRSRTGRSKTRCDVRTKIDIAPLTNLDLIRDDLANIAYFVKEIK